MAIKRGDLFSPEQALRELANLLDPKYKPYFLSGEVRLLTDSEFVSAEERSELRTLRSQLLSGENLDNVKKALNKYDPPGRQNNANAIGIVFDGVRYVTPSEDPAGRNPSTPGFGRAPGTAPSEDIDVDERRALLGSGENDTRPTPEQALGVDERRALLGRDDEVSDDGDSTGDDSSGGLVDQTDLDAAIPQEWRDAAREAYPQYYAIVKNIPEVAQLLENAINLGYSDAQFQAELEQTNWWKQTTASAREWDINGERDPATQQTQIDNRTAFIQQTSLDTFGVRISAESAAELALDSLRQGWGQQFLLNSIGDVATQSTAGISQLRAGYIGQALRQTANDYGVAISEGTFNQFVSEIAVGAETQDTFQQYALTQAKNLFPSVADRLDAGETFQQIVDPYKQNAAKLLEIDADSIDFTSPDWAKAITYQDAKGEMRPMNFTEFNDYVRQTRSFGYEYTDQAKNKAYSVANELANLFGRI
mgnify:FL=1